MNKSFLVLFFKKELPSFASLIFLLPMPCRAADQDPPGRDFPKTLIFDEPGIDDEISLPTFIDTPQYDGGRDTELNVELDKRLTETLSVQINIGYSMLREATSPLRDDGWQNTDVTLKYIAYANPEAEQLASFSLTREVGGTGAARIGAGTTSATTAAINAGQGFASLATAPLLKPFAVTGSLGYLVPDTARGGAQFAVLSASLQYSMDVAFAGGGAGRLSFLQPLIPVVEASYDLPTTPGDSPRATLAPGLIYAGNGYQLAAEALLPLTRAAGHRIGFIAQLNISLRRLGIAALARPLF